MEYPDLSAYGAGYETFQHERIGGWVGLSPAAITAAATGTTNGLPDEEAVIVAWTDLLLDEHTLTGMDRDTAVELLGTTGLADLVLTVGFYQMVCNFLNTFEVTTDSEQTGAGS